jgi:hypothetical protein
MGIHSILADIQARVRATKDLKNDFGGYNYRSAESILESVKPLLAEHGAVIVLSDDVVPCGEYTATNEEGSRHSTRVYIKATATIAIEGESISTKAFAREPVSRKGMDDSQISGAASSYARKYALSGLLALDDNKDADATNTHDALNAYVAKTLEYLEIEDAPAMLELWSEIDDRTQHSIWREFNSHQKSNIRALLQEARKAEAKP